jgi:thioredoxin reductase (NADPH)
MQEREWDCLVVGAGPAGLTAATYLARFHRRVAVVDAGSSRARWIPATHNCPGFPFGVAGNELLGRFRMHAETLHVPIFAGRVEALEKEHDGFTARCSGVGTMRARTVILATGVVDRLPDIEGVEEAIHRGTVRLCAVCDGYEATDRTIAVLGPAGTAVGHAIFLRAYSSQVAVIPTDGCLDQALKGRAAEHQVAWCEEVRSIDFDADACRVHHNGGSHVFDVIYPVLGADPQTSLAGGLHAAVDETGELVTDKHMRTSVAGLYAAGDVVSGLNQISVAVGHAAIAAAAVHRELPARFRPTA